MKYIVTFLLFFLIKVGASQNTKITWLGIDFSHCKLIEVFTNKIGSKEESEPQRKYFYEWNADVATKPDNYPIAKVFPKKEIEYAVDSVVKGNFASHLLDLVAYATPDSFSLKDIGKIVGSYSLPSKQGVGALLIAECLNKPEAAAYFDFVLIDLQTKKILISERFKGVPNGFGTRSYWAYSIYSVIEEMRWKKYRI